MSKKDTQQVFTSEWNKSAAWAESQGIPPASIAPVYQMDLTRLNTTGQIMSAAERNRAILAAANPSSIPDVQSQTPSPSAVWSNARSDLGNIVTGLEPQKLIANIFDSFSNTVKDLFDPKRLVGSSLDATAANLFQDTLLSWIPGVYDVGTFLRAGGGKKGAEALAEHPLVSLLDVLPAGSSKLLTRAVADSAVGERLAAMTGQSTAALREQSLGKTVTNVFANMTPGTKQRIAQGDPAAGLHVLTVRERLQNMTGSSRFGVSKPIQDLAGELMDREHLATNFKQNLLMPAYQALGHLGPEDLKLFDQLEMKLRLGEDDFDRIMADPTYPLPVRDALAKMEDVVRYEREEAILAGPKVRGKNMDVAIVRFAGKTHLFAGVGHDTVKMAKARYDRATDEFMASLGEADKLKQARDGLDAQLAAGTTEIANALTSAQKVLTDGDKLMQNINLSAEGAPGQMVKLNLGLQRDQAKAVFGNGGFVSGLLDSLKQGNVDAAHEQAKILDQRMNGWGAHSVDAASAPEFTKLHAMVKGLLKITEDRQALDDEIHRRIDTAPSQTQAEVNQARAVLRDLQMTDRHAFRTQQEAYVENLRWERDRLIGMSATDRDQALSQLRMTRDQADLVDRARAKNARLRADGALAEQARFRQMNSEKFQATREGRRVETPAARAGRQQAKARAERERRFAVGAARRIEAETEKSIKARHAEIAKEMDRARAAHNHAATLIEKGYAEKIGKLTAENQHEFKAFKTKQAVARRQLGGELLQKSREWQRSQNEFQMAVYDHPTDEWRDVRYMLYTEQLLQSGASAELADITFKRLKEKAGWDQSRLAELQGDPVKLGEQFAVTADDIYNNPTNWNPDLVGAIEEARNEATNTAIAEINKLNAEGHRPVWLPAASSADRVTNSIRVVVGKGVPHVDISHERSNFLVNTRYDIVAGVDKAAAQAIKRDAVIDFMEEELVPRAISEEKLVDQLNSLGIGLETFDPSRGTLPEHYSAQFAKMGLTKFDPRGIFGFSFPRWEGKAMYLPSSLVGALEKLMAEQNKTSLGVLDKATGLFRMSILGLSPRYTAHILFGGTFLLALRSTPHMPMMLKSAAKAMREGSLPLGVFRHPGFEGYEATTHSLASRNEIAFDAFHEAAGKQMGNLATQENIARLFPEEWSQNKLSPVHWLTVAAEMNYRFTRHVVAMQSAVAYLDAATAAENRGYFIDEISGQKKVMTKERMMAEGMRHVEEVYGNLRNMAPIERSVAKTVMPFYGWTRHVLNYVLSFPADHPWRAMVLALMGYEDSAAVPEGLPTRIQFLFFLGSPNAQGNVTAFDARFLDPLRDVANYASLSGWIQSLNPAFVAPLAMLNPQMVYGSNELYPNVTFNQFYGIETAGAQGNAVTGLEQFVPQLGALGDAIKMAGSFRSTLQSNPNNFYKSIFESLNIPMFQAQHINVKQIAAHDEIARFQVAKQAAASAFQSGDFSGLRGYASVPNPLNPDYEIAPSDLEAMYNQAMQQYHLPPEAVLAAPKTPVGF